jgi:hypothetical protein
MLLHIYNIGRSLAIRALRAAWTISVSSKSLMFRRTGTWNLMGARSFDLKAPAVPRSDTDHTGPSIRPDRLASMPMARSARAQAVQALS